MRSQIRSSVATRYAKRLQTRESRAKEAISTIAVLKRISIRISRGIPAIGQGGGGEPSVGGGAAGIDKSENDAISWAVEAYGRPSREWWAVLGTVTGALEGLGSVGFILVLEGGKCLFL